MTITRFHKAVAGVAAVMLIASACSGTGPGQVTGASSEATGVVEDTAPVTPAAVYFEPNVGQADRGINFIGTGAGYKLLLEDDQVRLVQKGATIDIGFLGAGPDPMVVGSADVGGVSHYYHGDDPTAWIEDIPHYAEVTYADIYPGVDLVFHSRYGNPEYDFVVDPGVDPDVIGLDITGTDDTVLNTDGSLSLEAADSEPIIMNAPLVYQDDRTNTLAGSYDVRTDGTIGFDISDYDNTKPLIIDPELIFSTYVGGDGEFLPMQYRSPGAMSQGRGADETGVYRCMVSDSNVLPGFGALRTPPRPDEDTVCTKHDPTGQLIYATTVGGSANEISLEFTSDAFGRVHSTGNTFSTDHPVTANALQSVALEFNDGFVFTLDQAGQLEYASYLGGGGHALQVGPDGSLFIGGTTSSADFGATAGVPVNQLTPRAGPGCEGTPDPFLCSDNFLIELRPDQSVAYISTFGGDSNDQILGIAIDDVGAAYTTGITLSENKFPVTDGAFQTDNNLADPGPTDFTGFVVKLSPDGDEILYGSYLGGSTSDSPFEGGALDDTGAFIITGSTASADFPVTADAFQPTFGGASDGFVVKIRTDGNGPDDLVYSSFIGGSGSDVVPNSDVDRFGNVYLTGNTDSVDFPLTSDAFQDSLRPFEDAFVAVVRTDLPPDEQLLYSSYFGGGGAGVFQGADQGFGLGADGIGNVYIHGRHVPAAFDPPGPPPGFVAFPLLNAFQSELGGGDADGFVAKFHIWDEIGIDIKPGNDDNEVESKHRDFRLAILSSPSFSAPDEIDPGSIHLEGSTVRTQGNGDFRCQSKDVDKDGSRDLRCVMVTGELNVPSGESTANLVARTVDGEIVMGQDHMEFIQRR